MAPGCPGDPTTSSGIPQPPPVPHRKANILGRPGQEERSMHAHSDCACGEGPGRWGRLIAHALTSHHLAQCHRQAPRPGRAQVGQHPGAPTQKRGLGMAL